MMRLSTTGAECQVMDSLHNSYLADGCRVMWVGGLFGRIDCNAVWVDEDKLPKDKPHDELTVDDLPPGALFVTVTGDDGKPWAFPVQVVKFPLCQCPALMVDTRF